MPVERTFAWEDKFKRLLVRFEFKQRRHYGHETDGVHVDQSKAFLWCLKLATSYIDNIHSQARSGDQKKSFHIWCFPLGCPQASARNLGDAPLGGSVAIKRRTESNGIVARCDLTVSWPF